MPTPIPTPLVTVTTPCIHRQRAISADSSIRWICASYRFRPRLDTCGVVCFVFSSVRWPRRAACPFLTGLVPRDGLLASGQSLVRVRASSVLISGRKRPRRVRSVRGVPRPPFAPGTFPAYPPSSRITNTLRAGYRTLASSRPIVLLGRHVMASSVPGPGAPRPAATGRDRAGRAPTNRRAARASSDSSDKDRERIGRAIYPRRPGLSAHFGRSAHPPSGAPERAASAHLIRVPAKRRSAALLILAAAARRQGPHRSRCLWRRPRGLSPLTARFAAALPRASRSSAPMTGRHY